MQTNPLSKKGWTWLLILLFIGTSMMPFTSSTPTGQTLSPPVHSPVSYSTLFFGRIANLTTFGDIIIFDAVKTRVVTFIPFISFSTYHYGKFAVADRHIGFVGTQYIFSLCSRKEMSHIDLIAENMTFDAHTIIVDVNDIVVIDFINKDAGVSHNFAIYTDSSASDIIFRGENITGVSSITYIFIAPSTPDTYFFRCDGHPTTMYGDFIVF